MDLAILQWIDNNLHAIPFFNYFAKYVTLLGEYGLFGIVLCVIFLIPKKTRKVGIVMTVALALDFLLLNVILKNAVGRTRPYVTDPSLMVFLEDLGVHLPHDSSFPSGHTGASCVVAFVLLFYYKWKALPIFIVALLISLSRIFLCVHYPTDVLAAFVLSFVIALGCFIAAKPIERKIKERLSKRANKT